MRIVTDIFSPPIALKNCAYGKTVIQLGSCFSSHISNRLKRSGFDVLDNPFGVVFHPIPLAHQILNALKKQVPDQFLKRDDIYLNYQASSSVYAMSEESLMEQLQVRMTALHESLKIASHVFITFGSAHGYRLNNSGEVVANCHQQPKDHFQKECTDENEMLALWIRISCELKTLNPDMQIIFTVSPVKYSRDGWVENVRSKARLVRLCEALEAHGNSYFPSYELITDVLRDYRYYEADGTHPNTQAVDAVWHLFRSWFFNNETNRLVDEVHQLRSMEEHRLLYPESAKALEFKLKFQEKRDRFLSLHPAIRW